MSNEKDLKEIKVKDAQEVKDAPQKQVQETLVEKPVVENQEAKKEQEITHFNTSVTKEQLDKVKYGELLKTFTALGIPEVWKPGSKKNDMIAKALEKLAIIRELQNKGLEGEELQAAKVNEFEKAQAAVEKINEQEALDKETQKLKQDKDVKEAVEKVGLSKEQAEKNLKIIDANLKGASKGARAILLQKRKALQNYIAKGEFPNNEVESED